MLQKLVCREFRSAIFDIYYSNPVSFENYTTQSDPRLCIIKPNKGHGWTELVLARYKSEMKRIVGAIRAKGSRVTLKDSKAEHDSVQFVSS